MGCKVQKIIEIMEKLAPPALAEEWDNVGLLIGSPMDTVWRLMVALDITSPVVEEAIEKNIDIIITHHPVIFKPLSNIKKDSYPGGLIYSLIQNNIAVYCAHTNLDKASGGVEDTLAEKVLGLKEVSPLTYEYSEGYYRNESCSLENESRISSLGRIGKLPGKTTIGKYAAKLREILDTDNIQIVGESSKEVEILATCAGSGADLMGVAKARGADLFITGEVKYHDAQKASEMGLNLIVAGHFATELPIVPELIDRLQSALDALQYKVEVIPSIVELDPYVTIRE